MAAGMVGTAGMAALAAARFLPHQTLWIDEVTQMAGLGLGPIGVVRWLLHPTLTDLGVPSDRMPPLSYWLGWLWAQAFGLRVADPAPRHAVGWHTLWMRREDFLTHRPISPTAVHVMKHLPDGLVFTI